MASPEKALVDKVWADKRLGPANLKDFNAYLFEDLRMDAQRLSSLDPDRLAAIAGAFASRKITMLARFLARRSGNPEGKADGRSSRFAAPAAPGKVQRGL